MNSLLPDILARVFAESGALLLGLQVSKRLHSDILSHLGELRVQLAIKDIGLFRQYVEEHGGGIRRDPRIRILNLAGWSEGARKVPEEAVHWILDKGLPLLDLEDFRLRGLPSISEMPQGGAMLADRIQRLPNLQVLEVRYCFFDTSGSRSLVQALSRLHRLQRLDLACNELGEEGASSMLAVFSSLSALRYLNMGGNRLGHGGAPIMFSQAIAALTGLQQLNLVSNQLCGEGACSVARAIRAHTALLRLDLSSNSFFGPQQTQCAAEAIGALTGLQHLNICCTRLGAGGGQVGLFGLVGRLCELQSLECSGNAVGAQGLHGMAESFQRLTQLQYLYLGYNDLQDEGAALVAQAVRPLTGLRHLSLDGNELGDAAARHLAAAIPALTALRCLDLSVNRFGEDGARLVAEAARRAGVKQVYV